MDKKSENIPRPPKVYRDNVVQEVAGGMVRRGAERGGEDRKYALGSTKAIPSVRSSEPIQPAPKLPGSVPEIPREDPQGY